MKKMSYSYTKKSFFIVIMIYKKVSCTKMLYNCYKNELFIQKSYSYKKGSYSYKKNKFFIQTKTKNELFIQKKR